MTPADPDVIEDVGKALESGEFAEADEARKELAQLDG